MLKKLSISHKVCTKFKPGVSAAVQLKVLACFYWSEWEIDWILTMQPKVVIGVSAVIAISFCIIDNLSVMWLNIPKH